MSVRGVLRGGTHSGIARLKNPVRFFKLIDDIIQAGGAAG